MRQGYDCVEYNKPDAPIPRAEPIPPFMSSLSLILLLLMASVLGVILVRRVNMPPMFGYLLVGLLIGPHALSLLKNVKAANTLAEFGVVFLMFSIGLEFSLARLYTMRKTVFGFGMTQVLVTMAVIAGIAMACGLSWQAGLAYLRNRREAAVRIGEREPDPPLAVFLLQGQLAPVDDPATALQLLGQQNHLAQRAVLHRILPVLSTACFTSIYDVKRQ